MKRIEFVWSLALCRGLGVGGGLRLRAGQTGVSGRSPPREGSVPQAQMRSRKLPQPPRLRSRRSPCRRARPSLRRPLKGRAGRRCSTARRLAGWRETAFAGHGEVHCQDGVIVLGMGDPFTGINWTNDFPKMNYEVALDAMRVMGSDFFCGLTVPVGDHSAA